jgi:glycerophosphoryl diester phosphodiesterase
LKLSQVIAHRGMPRERPENTLAGFALALEAGVQGIELDVHATEDGVIVVHHDPHIEVVPRSAPQPIDRLRFDELPRPADGDGVPRLEEVLALVDGRATLYVEIKAPRIEQRVAALLAAHADWTAVHSFDHRIIAVMRALAPTLRRGVLMSSYLLDPLAPVRDTDAHDLWQHWSMLDEPLVRRAREEGATVIAWTVNDPAVARVLQSWGVTGICTDVPREIAAAVR